MIAGYPGCAGSTRPTGLWETRLWADCRKPAAPLYTGREIQGLCDERRHSPGLSRDYGADDRRLDVSDALDLRQRRRHAAAGDRPEIAPGLDRRPAAAARHGRAAGPLQPPLPGLRAKAAVAPRSAPGTQFDRVPKILLNRPSKSPI